MSHNSRLKAIYIIGQKKAFYEQRIPESSFKRTNHGSNLLGVLAKEIMQESQSNFEEKDNPGNFKDDFPRIDPLLFSSVAPFRCN